MISFACTEKNINNRYICINWQQQKIYDDDSNHNVLQDEESIGVIQVEMYLDNHWTIDHHTVYGLFPRCSLHESSEYIDFLDKKVSCAWSLFEYVILLTICTTNMMYSPYRP